MSKYMNPENLIQAIEDLNDKLMRGEIADLQVAGLMIRGHSNAARVQTNAIKVMSLAQKAGVLRREEMGPLLPASAARSRQKTK